MKLRAVFSLLGLAGPSAARLFDPDASISRNETGIVPPADVGGVPLLDPEGIDSSAVPPADVNAAFADPEGGIDTSAASPADAGASVVDLEGANVAGNDLDVYANETQDDVFGYDDTFDDYLFVGDTEVDAQAVAGGSGGKQFRLCRKEKVGGGTPSCIASLKCSGGKEQTYLTVLQRYQNGKDYKGNNVMWTYNERSGHLISVKCPGKVMTYSSNAPDSQVYLANNKVPKAGKGIYKAWNMKKKGNDYQIRLRNYKTNQMGLNIRDLNVGGRNWRVFLSGSVEWFDKFEK